MYLNKLLLKDYGKFNNKELVLHKGVNVCYGEEGSGKSTMKDFVVDMIYGANTDLGAATGRKHQENRKPTEGTGFSGKAYITAQGKRYLIERSFLHRSKKTSLLNVDDGRDIKLVNKHSLYGTLVDMDKNQYQNAMCMEKPKSSDTEAMAKELRLFLGNFITTGTPDLNKKKIVGRLQEKQQIFENEIAPLDRQLEEIQNEMELYNEVDDALDDIHKKMREIDEELAMETAKRKREARRLIETQIQEEDETEESANETVNAKADVEPDGKSDSETNEKSDMSADGKSDSETNEKSDMSLDGKSDSETNEKSDMSLDGKSEENSNEKTDGETDEKSDMSLDETGDAESDERTDGEEGIKKKKRKKKKKDIVDDELDVSYDDVQQNSTFLNPEYLKEVKARKKLTDRLWFIILVGLLVIGVIAAMVYILPFEAGVRQLFVICTIMFVIVTIVEGLYAKGAFDDENVSPTDEEFKRIVYELERKTEAYEEVEIDMSFAKEYTDRKNELIEIENVLLEKKNRRDSLSEGVEGIETKKKELQKELHAVMLAINTVNATSLEIKRKMRSILRNNAAEFVSIMTDGKCSNISLDNRYQIFVHINGEEKGLDALDAKTMKEVFVAAHLAVAKFFEKSDVPFVIEDLFQDNEKAEMEKLAKCLNVLGQEQVIVLTSNKEMKDICGKVIDNVHSVEIA